MKREVNGSQSYPWQPQAQYKPFKIAKIDNSDAAGNLVGPIGLRKDS